MNKKDQIIEILQNNKAEDVFVTRVDSGEQVIIVTATSVRHVSALVDYVTRFLKQEKLAYSVDGVENYDEWFVVACYNMTVHIFTASKRQEYSLEEILQRAHED